MDHYKLVCIEGFNSRNKDHHMKYFCEPDCNCTQEEMLKDLRFDDLFFNVRYRCQIVLNEDEKKEMTEFIKTLK